MTGQDDLTTTEGVDEGSADSTAESGAEHPLDQGDSQNDGSGVTGALGAASQDGEPRWEYDPAPPLETGLPGSTTPAGKLAPGQQLEQGEG